MLVTPSGIVILDRLVQREKAPESMPVMLYGIVILVKPVQ